MKFIDALYGEIDLGIPKWILSIPELQRLREVRLCNVNSPYITGGTNLNRFEHAIGTAFLAEQLTNKNKIKEPDKSNFIIASLLHDFVTPPFGHSLEYLFDALGKSEYEHAQLDTLFKGKTVQSSRKYYMDRKSILMHKIDSIDIKNIRKLMMSEHYLSRFLIGEIDIDNIDNVYRFAYHIGIKFDHDSPVYLANNINYINNYLILNDENIIKYKEWYETRKKLYKYLLEDSGEFVAKALLERVFIELIKAEVINQFDWILVDYELVQKALLQGNKIAKNCIQKYMLMDFPEFHEIYYTNEYKKIDNILLKDKISIIEKAFKKNVLVHFIRDVNKTQRVIKGVLVDSNNNQLEKIIIGEQNDRYLIGLFSDSLEDIVSTKKYIENTYALELKKLNLNEKTKEKQIPIF